MAILSYKVHVRDKNDSNHNTDETAWVLNCYTTVAEAKPVSNNGNAISGECWELKNNGTVCYIGLVPVNSSYTTYKTPLKIKKNGIEYYAQTQTVNKYSVTIKATSNQTITFITGGVTTTVTTADKTIYVSAGASYTCSVSANIGYTKGTLSGASASGNVNANMTVSCSAATKSPYTVSWTLPTGAKLTLGSTTYTTSSNTSKNYNDQFKILAESTDTARYKINTVTVNDAPFTNGNTYTMSTDSVSIVVTVSDVYHTITLSKGTGTTLSVKNGTTEITSGSSVLGNTTLTYTTTANTGYYSPDTVIS